MDIAKKGFYAFLKILKIGLIIFSAELLGFWRFIQDTCFFFPAQSLAPSVSPSIHSSFPCTL